MVNICKKYRYTALSLVMLLNLAGCMYPGMDNASSSFGENTRRSLNSQMAFPEAGDENSDRILSNTDGERGSLILDNHRRDVSTKDDFNKPININIGGK